MKYESRIDVQEMYFTVTWAYVDYDEICLLIKKHAKERDRIDVESFEVDIDTIKKENDHGEIIEQHVLKGIRAIY